MYLKRNKAPKEWPLPRKGSKYLVVASHAGSRGIPLLLVLRDILKIARTRKEVKYLMLNGDVKVNNKLRKDEKFPIQVFDVINLEKINKNYRLNIVNRKFKLEEVKGEEVNKKIVKIVGKKILGRDKVQMNLQDGDNFITKEKFNVGDSALVNTKDGKIVKILELKSGAKVEIISGKHAGEKGELNEIIELEKGKRYSIKLKDKEVNLPIKTVLVIG